MPENPEAPASLAIVNSRVWTNDPRRPWAEAVLVRGEHIVAVGSSAELRKRAGSNARIVDGDGQLVLPASVHGVLGAGMAASLLILDRGQIGDSRASADTSAVRFSLVDGRIERDLDQRGR